MITPTPSTFPATVCQVPTLGIFQSLVLFLSFFCTLAAVHVTASVFGLRFDSQQIALLGQCVAWTLTIGLALHWSEAAAVAACSLRSFPLTLTPSLVLASLGSTIVLLQVASLIPMPESLGNALLQQHEAADSTVLFISIGVVAPIAEEVFFRGLLLQGFLSRYSVTKSLLSTSLLFAMFHLNPWQAVSAFPLALALGWLAIRTRSIFPGMISHALMNVSANFLIGPLQAALGYDSVQYQHSQYFPPAVLGLGFSAAVAGGLLVWRHPILKRS